MGKREFAPKDASPVSRVPNPVSRGDRFPELHPALDAHAVAIEASRCLFCYDAPCTAACPTHIDVPGSQYEFACDMVIPAIGQARLTALLENTRGIAVKNGLVVVDRPTGRTANPRYFAGVDCVNGGREMVDAVADGKRAALAMSAQMEA